MHFGLETQWLIWYSEERQSGIGIRDCFVNDLDILYCRMSWLKVNINDITFEAGAEAMSIFFINSALVFIQYKFFFRYIAGNTRITSIFFYLWPKQNWAQEKNTWLVFLLLQILLRMWQYFVSRHLVGISWGAWPIGDINKNNWTNRFPWFSRTSLWSKEPIWPAFYSINSLYFFLTDICCIVYSILYVLIMHIYTYNAKPTHAANVSYLY